MHGIRWSTCADDGLSCLLHRRPSLQLFCSQRKPVTEKLDVWRALPIVISVTTTGTRPQGMARSRVTRTRELGVLAMVFEAMPEHGERCGIIDCELKAIHCRTLVDVRGQRMQDL
jgi:hypothetical protein